MIEISCDVFSFSFRHHVNVIGGVNGLIFDSATNKSYFFSELEAQQNLGRLTSNCTVHFVTSPYSMDVFLFRPNTCIVLDEANFSPAHLNDLFQRIREANANLIIIGRLLMEQLEYSVGL